jgi:hypothetical protein
MEWLMLIVGLILGAIMTFIVLMKVRKESPEEPFGTLWITSSEIDGIELFFQMDKDPDVLTKGQRVSFKVDMLNVNSPK